MPPIQDLEDSLEEEYSTAPELDQTVFSSPLDNHSKPHDPFNSDPLLLTLVTTLSPNSDADSLN
jgi:hypothetical protein